MANEPVVQVRSVTHRYGERVALDVVSFDVPRPAVFGLLGPNGGGKSTLFKILTTLIRPTSGGATIAGADVVADSATVRRRIGIVFQRPSLDGKLTVGENLMHQGHLYGLRGGELKSRSREMMERFAIADRKRDRVDTLSGGLQRRVELAKSLLHRPGVLILDEPSTGLDPGARMQLIRYLIELRDNEGVTSLLTTHLMDEAEGCDRVAILDRGKLVAVDSPSRLKESIGGDVITLTTRNPQQLAGQVTSRFSLKAEVVDSVVRIERDLGHEFVPTLIEAFPGEVDSITVGKPTLDDVFVHLTGHNLESDQSEVQVPVSVQRRKH